jgi:hypothetical protein
MGDKREALSYHPSLIHLLRLYRFLSRLPFSLAEAAGLQGLNDSQRFFG